MKDCVLKLAVGALAAAYVSVLFAGPEQDFDAAIKEGRPLSAEAAYLKLVKSGAKVAPIRHYQAAQVADQLGKTTLRDDRQRLYLRLEAGWKPEVERLLWLQCSTGTDVDLFARLNGNSKADRALWSVGYGMLGRLAAANRPSEVLRLADILLAKFKGQEQVANVLTALCDNARNCDKSYPRDTLARLIARTPGLGACGEPLYNLLYNGNQRDAFPDDFAMRYVAKHGGPMGDDTLNRSMECLDKGGIENLKEADKISERDARVATLKKIQGFVFDGQHPRAALRFVRIAGARLPGSFFPGWKKDAPAPGLAALVAKLESSDLYKSDPSYRREAIGQRNDLVNRKCFSENEVAAFKKADEKLPKENPAVAEAIKELRAAKSASDRAAAVRKLIQLADKNTTFWGDIEWGCHQVKDGDLWYAYRMRQAEITGDHSNLSGCYKKGKDPYPGIDMKKMSASAAWGYVQNIWNNLKGNPARDQVLLDYLASRPLAEQRADFAQWAIGNVQERALDKAFAAKVPIEDIVKQAFSGKYPRFSWDFYQQVLRTAFRVGKFDAAFAPYVTWAEALEPQDRVAAYMTLLGGQVQLPKEDGKGTYGEWLIKPNDRFVEILTGKCVAALNAVPDVRLGLINVNFGYSMWDRAKNIRNEFAKDEAKAKDVAAIDGFYDVVTAKVLAGARNEEGCGSETMAWHRRLRKAIDGKDAPAAAAIARRTGASIVWHWIGVDGLLGLMKDFSEMGAPEAFYLYVNAVTGDQHDRLVAAAAKYRAEIASQLPGIYPVGENDPAYPLYVAADELSKKNSERAWQILQNPRNQTVFEREALKLPPDFVIWGVEQLRMARGDKDKLLLKARQIATAILAQEAKVSPEMAAAMILSRAEGYRDQQNFEAAKLEYQSVRDNPTYHNTKYGKKAMFRAMDLQIATGNAQGVEATLEYWLSQNDREVQAQAHYFLAKLAFDRKDYDECIKQLRLVFAVNFTHTEARFLHGEWKLATNSEVDDTDVLVGDLAERNMIRPGNQLTVTVQDANLSVAGGGASIPVVVTSEPGGDRERINLYPSSRDPSSFKGLVEVQIGKACPSNRVLEVRGDDTVSYVIDPDFLKERGLPLNVPKQLRVIDDAKLAIGAGAPRTEEKKAEESVRDLLEENMSLEDAGLARKLRPGNPLYVVVKDRDCSLGGEADAVRVTVETSSGDRLEGFELKEEKPFSGVFRGKIETSLPPPRAFASDTAAGMNAGDVINAGRKNGWKSLADGQPGKWFEVDTMGSHLFSEIALDTPGVEDIKVIKLVGRMGSKVMQLGQLPVASEASKLYLRRQQQYDRRPQRSLGQLRAFCQTDKAAKRVIVEKIDFSVLQKGNNGDWQTALYSGPLHLPEGVDTLRLRIVPASAKKDALRNLWVALAIDGEEVFSGQGAKLQNALMTADVTSGCHQLELAVVANSHADDFSLLWEPVGKDPVAIPADWFKEDQHPALKAFVKDRVQIVKTANGFKALFDKPVRLRSFRWEFADVKSPEVAVTRISAKDDRGEAVLPVASDFSDSQNNQTLEVAPGDKITVKYEDERTTSGEKKVLQRDMESSFNDAKVRFIFEEANEHGMVTAYDAFRFQPGDSLVLCVLDPDCDVTDEPDKVEVSIRNGAGETFKKTLTEYQPRWHERANDSYGMHSGVFMGVLKTCRDDVTNAPPQTLRVKSDDLLTVTYEDRENTDPGVPCARTVRIFAARPAEPQMTLFSVRKVQEIDRTPDAKIRLERIRRRPGNENVNVVYRDVLLAEPMPREVLAGTNAIPVNVAAGAIPVRVNDRSRARYACSKVMVEAVAHSEIEKAAAEGRDPAKVTVPLQLGGSLKPFKVTKGDESPKEAHAAGTFNGLIRLSLGPVDPNIELPEDAPPLLCVTGSDLIDLTVLDEDGQPVLTRTLKLVSDATLGLTDSSFEAERDSAHVGESFFVKVDDADRDATDEPDRIEATAVSSKTGVKRPIILTETMPHSGVFTGRLRPVMFAPGEKIPSVATGGVASANEVLTEERFAVGYGDKVIFRYKDDLTLPGTPALSLSATGTVFRGADGNVRLFSKRFADRDTAVLVQFRLAECLFEQAKEFRNLKQPEKSAAAIDEGKFILEEALKNYPDSSHVVQGEYLLANLYQELAAEQKEAGDMEKATPLYQEALSRFSQILGTWPEGDYAARSQYHKAFCLEMLQDYNRAAEEYVKMTYLYPESDLVGEATIRLATYYYTKEKRYDISGHIYRNFQQRFPQHEKAARALFMAGSCYIKQAETVEADVEQRKEQNSPIPRGYEQKVGAFYRDAVKTFDTLIETYRDGAAKLRAQTLYWAGDVSVRLRDYTKAYQYLKRTVFEYPETEWARRARGLLLQEDEKFKDFE